MSNRAYVAFGANLGDAASMYAHTRAALAALPATRVTAHSALYRSAPILPAGTPAATTQPDYHNAVVALETSLAPLALLDALLDLETRAGRTRPHANAPRPLDLDLLLYADRIIDHPRLSVPHPRMAQRAFVLMPLAEIAPDAIIPGQPPLAELLAGVREQRIERLPASA